jgi:6-phosphogluconolactonase
MPRNFSISPDGKYVFVANQNTDNIVIFERNASTGLLLKTGKEIKISMPVCIKFL